MLTEEQVLAVLDNCFEGYCHSITLSHPYTFLIDSRVNIFKGEDDRWAVVAEVLGYTPSASAITLELTYFGNCLINLEPKNNQPVNSIQVGVVDDKSFEDTIDYDVLKEDAEYWIVRGQKLMLSHNKQNYIDAGITLKEYEPGEICAEEIGRLLIIQNSQLFRATDDELHTCIPRDLKKILVLDEWYHKEYFISDNVPLNILPSPEQLMQAYLKDDEIKEKIQMDADAFANIFLKHDADTKRFNDDEWNNNRPGSYETWQLLAKVIVTGDTSFYKPVLPPNSHWKNWPNSGYM